MKSTRILCPSNTKINTDVSKRTNNKKKTNLKLIKESTTCHQNTLLNVESQQDCQLKSVYKKSCILKDFDIPSNLTKTIFKHQNIRRVAIQRLEHHASESGLSNIHTPRPKPRSFLSSLKTCKNIIWQDNLQLKQFRLLLMALKNSKTLSLELDLLIIKFRINSLSPYKRILKNLPKTLESLTINITPHHILLKQSFKTLLIAISKLPKLKILTINYEPDTTLVDIDFILLSKTLKRTKSVKQVILAPLKLTSQFGDLNRYRDLYKLQLISSLGLSVFEPFPEASENTHNFFAKVNAFKAFFFRPGAVVNDINSIFASVTNLQNIEELHIDFSYIMLPFNDLLNLKGTLKALTIKYYSLQTSKSRQFESNLQVLTLLDSLEALNLTLNGSQISNMKYFGVCMSQISKLRSFVLRIEQGLDMNCMTEFFKAFRSENSQLERFEVSVVFSEKRVAQELEALSNCLKKHKKLRKFGLITLEAKSSREASIKPGDLLKLFEGLLPYKNKLTYLKIHIVKLEGFSDRKSGVIISDFLKDASSLEMVDLEIGKRYFTDGEVRAILKWMYEAKRLKKVVIGGDLSFITFKGFSVMIDFIRDNRKGINLSIIPKGFSKFPIHDYVDALDHNRIRRIFN